MSQSLDARPDIVSKSTVLVSHPAGLLICQIKKKKLSDRSQSLDIPAKVVSQSSALVFGPDDSVIVK